MKKFNKSSQDNARISSINLNDISIKSIVKDVFKQITLIILCAVVGFCGFFVVKNETYVPQYTSNATFMVTTRGGSGDAFANLVTTTKMNEVFKMIIESTALQDAVKADLGQNEFDAKIEANMIENTNLLELSVSSDSPKKSYDTLCSVIRNYPVFSQEVMQEAVLYTFDTPTVPSHKEQSSQSLMFGAFGMLGGLLLSTALVVYFSIKKDTVKNYQQVNEKLATRLISSIPCEKNKSENVYINNISVSFEYKEAFNELRSKIIRDSKSNGNKCYAICSSTNNEGKTTIAINLAYALAKQSYKVLLVDMDYNKPQIYKKLSIDVDNLHDFQSCFYGNEIEDLSKVIITNSANNVDMILSAVGYSDVNRSVVYDRLKTIFEQLKNNYDFIIVDTASVNSVASVDNVINACDTSIIVVRQDFEKAEKINDSLDALTITGKSVLGAVLNYSDAKKSSAYGYAYYGGYKSKYGYSYGGYKKYSSYDKQK